jgi:hypothetical protein
MNSKLRRRWLQSIKIATKDVVRFSNRKSNEDWVKPMIDLVKKRINNNGFKETIKLLKAERVFIQQVLLEQVVEPLNFHRIDKSGFPLTLRPWKHLIQSKDIANKRFVLSLWRVLDVLTLEPTADIKSIVEPQTSDLPPEDFEDFVNWLSGWKGLKALPKKLDEANVILSNKAGPNGVCSGSLGKDLYCLIQDQGLWTAIISMIQQTGSSPHLLGGTIPDSTGKTHSKIVALADKFGKTRTVAIGDWYSNVSLSPLHNAFMQGLRNLPSDCTYRQSDIPKLIKGLGNQLHSSDLSSFTDRFPRKWEVAVIAAKYGQTVSQLWETIISNREFKVGKTLVSYKVGNPMGILSSWAVSSFTHHAFVEWSAHRMGKPNTKYMMLGDDVIISDYDVSKEYQSLMVKLGVSISLSKCTNSSKGFCEFAKRLFTPDGEITGIPSPLFISAQRNPELLISLVKILRERGYDEPSIRCGVQAYLTPKRKQKELIALVLSAPLEISGSPPIEGLENLLKTKKTWSSEGLQLDDILKKSKEYYFWAEVDKITEYIQKGTYPVPLKGKRVHIAEGSPIVVGISERLEKYLASEDDFSIWNDWLKGESWNMVLVPNLDTYRYINRGHKMSKAKYKIILKAYEYYHNLVDDSIQPERQPLSNFQLFELGFPNNKYES